MSGMICSGEHNKVTDPARASLDVRTLARVQPALEEALRSVLAASGSALFPSPFNAAVLENTVAHVLVRPCSDDERRRYLLFIAPVTRRLLLAHVGAGGVSAALDPALLLRWLQRLESFDPLSALMIDLRYFAGLSLRRTAAVVGVSAHTVVHDMRFAKAWLEAYVGEPLSRRRLTERQGVTAKSAKNANTE